jgi:hypothetical protein
MAKGIFIRHSAELVISFAVPAVIPAQAAGPIGEFLQKWVGTMLPLTEIIGQVMTSNYVSSNFPVFSQQPNEHSTVITRSSTVIAGREIRCINNCSTSHLSTSSKGQGKETKWRVTCGNCGMCTSYKTPQAWTIDEKDVEKIMAIPGQPCFWTEYPVPLSRVVWSKKQEPPPKKSHQSILTKRGRKDSIEDPSASHTGGLTQGSSKPLQKKRSKICEPISSISPLGCHAYNLAGNRTPPPPPLLPAPNPICTRNF